MRRGGGSGEGRLGLSGGFVAEGMDVEPHCVVKGVHYAILFYVGNADRPKNNDDQTTCEVDHQQIYSHSP